LENQRLASGFWDFASLWIQSQENKQLSDKIDSTQQRAEQLKSDIEKLLGEMKKEVEKSMKRWKE
jgi:hypothetical protein